MTTPLTIQTYAKINLILRVAPQLSTSLSTGLSTGFHPICSWMHAIDLHDQIELSILPEGPSEFVISWSSGDPVEWETESDLVFRAHALLERELNCSLPARICVTKSIPAGGGMGGGSSNAAGVLLGLNRMFALGLDQHQLRTIAHGLGTDIPYFIDIEAFESGVPQCPAVVSGIGDRIEPTDRVSSSITLLIPSFGCPTGTVYRAFDELGEGRGIDHDAVMVAANRGIFDQSVLSNDLSTPARQAVPELDAAMSALESLGIHPHLSGSGSTMYVIGHLDAETMDRIASKLPSLRMVHTRLV
tara:strand:- start:73806 stop:74711 length:906 start_codon:yes stop_codon:yes gene_type:complete